ncbi:MAG: methyltransferase domain-containing protein, partial [Chitinophagaceae bacterium]|nr:methyltransferase domain-containing protein [Chitinophagaceae bacterium]
MEDLDETEKYDVIFCMNAINHVRNLPLCYDKLVKALKPDGYLIVSTDAHRNGFLKKLFQLLPGDMLHPVQLDIREYENFLAERKMHILKSFLVKREPIFDYYVTVSQKKAS